MKNLSVRAALIVSCLVIAVTCGLIASGAGPWGLGQTGQVGQAGQVGQVGQVKQLGQLGQVGAAQEMRPIRSSTLRAGIGAAPVTAVKLKLKIKIKIKLPKPIKIKFNGNGGTVVGQASKTVYNGKTFGALPDAKRSGYNFNGWYTSKKNGSCISPDTVVKLTRAKTYYAHWEKAKPFGPPMPPATVLKVNINTANANRLTDITGVGSKLADAIITYRKTHGLFPRTEDLMKVKGIGKAKYEKMKNQVTV